MIGCSLAQERLDFQLELASETTTSRAGLALFQEAALVSGVRKSIRAHLPAPGSNHGLKPEECVLLLVLMFCGGGRTMEEIREIASADGLRQLCGSARPPGGDAIGQRLRRRPAMPTDRSRQTASQLYTHRRSTMTSSIQSRRPNHDSAVSRPDSGRGVDFQAV
jgi:hypothetical protein